eukprot:SAG22_NODE_5580_length_990_cov_1.636364_1_plen_58_part_10
MNSMNSEQYGSRTSAGAPVVVASACPCATHLVSEGQVAVVCGGMSVHPVNYTRLKLPC